MQAEDCEADMTNEPVGESRLPEDETAEGAFASMSGTEAAGTQPPPPPPAPPGPKRLTRSRDDEWIGGVAGGLAEYFDTDPTLIRIAFVLAIVLSSGFAIIGYVVAWIVIPEAPAGATSTSRPRRSGGQSGALFWGGLLIILGTVFLLVQLDLDIDLPSWQVGLSAALIFVGVLMLVEARRGFHGGLMTLAVALTVILGLSAATNFNLAVDGAFGDSRYQVTEASDLRGDYSHAFGSMIVDLRDLELREGTTDLSLSSVFGSVVLDLPPDVPFRLEASSIFGSVDAPGVSAEGIAANRTYTSPGYEDAERRLDIEISVVFGSGRIR